MKTSPGELEPVGKAIVTARRRLSDGTIEPALNIYRARARGSTDTNPNADVFLAADPDPFYGYRALGVMTVEHADRGPDHLGINVEDTVASEPPVLHDAVQGLMEELGESEVIITSSDTNVPETVIRQIGGVGLEEGAFEVHLAA